MTGRVSENFDDPASRDFAVVALLDHPSELSPKPEQAADPALDGFKLIGGDLSHLLARCVGHFLQSEHRLDGRDVETEVPGVADKCQPPDVFCSVKASSTLSA
jgi:hypothetical protein